MAKTQSKSKQLVCPFLDIDNSIADGTKCAALQQIISSMSDDLFCRLNLITGTFDYISPSFRQIFGLSADELANMTTKQFEEEFLHPDDRLLLQDAFRHLIATHASSPNKSIVIEHRFKSRNGNYRWYKATLSVTVDKNGVPSAMIAHAQDISELIDLRNKLELSHLRFKNLYDNARVALFYSTADGQRLLECNTLFAWTLGFSSPAQCMEDFSFARNSINFAEFDKFALDTRNSRVVKNRELQLRRKDGSICWLNISAFWYEGESLGGSVLDITAVKELSEIETDVFKLLMAGLSSKEIAARLNRSTRTVEQHRASIMKKLNAQNLIDLANRYYSVTS